MKAGNNLDKMIQILNKCERMAQHSFVHEALDVINNPFKEIQSNRRVYVQAVHKAMQVDYPNWTYEISRNLPGIMKGMKDFSQRAITFNKFGVAINELYFLNLLQSSSIDHYKYLVFAYGQVPHYQDYKFHFKNQNDDYVVCVRPLVTRDVVGLVERIKQKLPEIIDK